MTIKEAAQDKMANKHCYMHNAVVSRDMYGVKGHVHDCEVGPRWQHRKRDKISHKGLLKVRFLDMGHKDCCNIPKFTSRN